MEGISSSVCCALEQTRLHHLPNKLHTLVPGASEFIELWAKHRGCLEVLATTPELADNMPGAEVKAERKGDYLDTVPVLVRGEDEEEPDEVQDEADGRDSEDDEETASDGGDGGGAGAESGPVAEGVLDDGELSQHVEGLLSNGGATSFYAGTKPGQVARWRRQGSAWWGRFWSAAEDERPPTELEPELGWADKYDYCDAVRRGRREK